LPKARQFAGWLVIAGVALSVQGCWENEQKNLTLLGEGGCRFADGGGGQPIYISRVSLDECEAKCFNGNAKCTAVEYNTNNSQCEIHSELIAKYEEVKGVFCYIAADLYN
jgi:hypothetical protein